MGREDLLLALQIGDGAGHAEDAVVAAARQAQPVEGPLHQLLPGGIQLTILPDHGGGHIGVAGDAGTLVAPLLRLSGGVDPAADLLRALRLLLAAHGLVLHRRHLYVHIDAVQQGAGDAAQVALHLTVRAGAAAGGMAEPAAPAGIHGAHQHEPAGQGQGTGGTGDSHHTVLQRLAQGLQRRLVKLRQLVQKQDPRQTSRSITIIETLSPEKVIYDHISKAIPTGYYLLPWGRGNYPVLPHHKAEG